MSNNKYNRYNPNSSNKTIKKTLLHYPSVQTFVNFIENESYNNDDLLCNALLSFFNSNESKIPLVLNKNDLNILVINTNEKTISSEVTKLVNKLDEEGYNFQNVRVFVIECPQNIVVIGKLPCLLKSIQPNFPFDVILCQRSFIDYNDVFHIPNLSDDKTLLILDKNTTRKNVNFQDTKLSEHWCECDFLPFLYDCFLLKENVNINCCNNIKESDINIGHFLFYITKQKETLEETLIRMMNSIINKSIVNITLNVNKFNILVMCSTNESIDKQVYNDILADVINGIDNPNLLENANYYHVGCDISVQKYPFVQRCNISNLHITDTKFDIIISEHCPVSAMIESIDLISLLLKQNGLLIVPYYSKILNLKRYSDLYVKSDNYRLLKKDY